MSVVYTAATPLEAEILRAYLAAHGIEAEVLGTDLWSARGELAVDAYPRLWLRDERDTTRAQTLLRQYQEAATEQGEWTCRCGEAVPAGFDCCWSCQQPRPA